MTAKTVTTENGTFGQAKEAMELFDRCETTGLLTAAEEFGNFMDLHCFNTVKTQCDDQMLQTDQHLMRDGTVWTATFEGNFEAGEGKVELEQSFNHGEYLKLAALNG